MKSSLRFGVLLVLILFVGVIVNAWSYLGEAHVERKELKAFPTTIGGWQKTGNDQILDDATMKVLRASDYLLRDFRKADGPTAFGHFAMNIGRLKHGLGLIAPKLPCQSLVQFSLVAC